MKCGFCGREIPDDVEQRACGACAGGCRNIHCPACGYKNPVPSGLLKRWLDKKNDKKNDKEQP